MKKFLINLFLPKKYKNMFVKLKSILKGKKAYIAGAIMILQGLSLTVDTVVSFENIGQFVDWIGTFMGSDGGLKVVEGLAVFGIRAGIKNK